MIFSKQTYVMLLEQRASTDPTEKGRKPANGHIGLTGLKHRDQRSLATKSCRGETNSRRFRGNSGVKPGQYEQLAEV